MSQYFETFSDFESALTYGLCNASCAVVDLDQLSRNVQVVAKHTGKKLMAVVKADAYGHGMVQAAFAALQGGATYLGVARANEALALVDFLNGVDWSSESMPISTKPPVLLLGFSSPRMWHKLVSRGVHLTFYDATQIKALHEMLDSEDFKLTTFNDSNNSNVNYPEKKRPDSSTLAHIHIKVDTGMNRLGVKTHDQFKEALQEAQKSPHIHVAGIFTHFCRADDPSPGGMRESDLQEFRFKAFLESAKGLLNLNLKAGQDTLVHAGNSAVSMTRASAFFDMTRLGISMYGLKPSDEVELLPGMAPALKFFSQIAQIKTIEKAGEGLSYGHKYVVSESDVPMLVGTVPCGYADGWRRASPGELRYVVVRGKRCKVLGTICMDQCMVQLDRELGAKVGDPVELIGDTQTADHVAHDRKTINYEVTCNIGGRVPRVYVWKS